MHVFRHLCILEARGEREREAYLGALSPNGMSLSGELNKDRGQGFAWESRSLPLSAWQSEMLATFYSADFFIMHRVELKVSVDLLFSTCHYFSTKSMRFFSSFSLLSSCSHFAGLVLFAEPHYAS